MTRYIDLVMDLQFGSTGKGLLAGWLAKNGMHDTVMTAWAPNAGHTNIDENGRKFVHTMLANGIVGPHVRRVMIGPGSVLNLDNLLDEINQCYDIIAHKQIQIFVHPNAAAVFPQHIEAEQGPMTAIGSTKKGAGEAAIAKIRRDPNNMNVVSEFPEHSLFRNEFVHMVESPMSWLDIWSKARMVLIEGAQGFGLSIQHGFYPYVTSRDVTPSQILADCGVPFQDSREVCVWGTARTYPIRVANRFNEAGEQVGWSGPCFPDQSEITFEEIGQKVELTTVTKLPRRIFTWSDAQMDFARGICSPNVIFLNFVNYLDSYYKFEEIYDSLEEVPVVLGVGPTVNDVIDTKGLSAREAWVTARLHMGKGE